MRKYSYTEKGFTFERISKKTAMAAYVNGLSVVICPVNLRPGAPGYPDMTLNKRNREQFVIDEIGTKNDFNNLVASFEYYNCTCRETGRYSAFYIPVKTIGTVKQYDYRYLEV